MQTKITATTAVGGLGASPGQKLFKVLSGEYAGRLLALFKTSNNEIKYAYADHPYTSWSTPVSVAADASASSFDAVIDSDGNVHVVYCETSTEYLVTKKLTFSSGTWSVGSKVYIYNGDITLSPSLAIESDSILWISYLHDNSGLYEVKVKSSTDGGASWGTGSADAGDSLYTGVAVPKTVLTSNHIYVVYAGNWSDILIRSRLLSGGSWSTEYTIASGTGIDEQFDAAALPEGLLGVVFDANAIKYREFDGSNWGSLTTLDSNEGSFPQITFSNNIPVVVYLSELDTDQIQVKYVHRRTGTFSSPAVLDNRADVFTQVLLYDSTSVSYSDLTTTASSTTSADLYHPSSNVLVENSGDIIYLGMDQKFRYLKSILSIAGIGGTIVFSYWDGSNWKSFTPSTGAFNLDSLDKDLLLWDDFNSVPQDWQKNLVNGDTRFWMKMETASVYSTAPIGSMLTAVSEIKTINIRR